MGRGRGGEGGESESEGERGRPAALASVRTDGGVACTWLPRVQWQVAVYRLVAVYRAVYMLCPFVHGYTGHLWVRSGFGRTVPQLPPDDHRRLVTPHHRRHRLAWNAGTSWPTPSTSDRTGPRFTTSPPTSCRSGQRERERESSYCHRVTLVPPSYHPRACLHCTRVPIVPSSPTCTPRSRTAALPLGCAAGSVRGQRLRDRVLCLRRQADYQPQDRGRRAEDIRAGQVCQEKQRVREKERVREGPGHAPPYL